MSFIEEIAAAGDDDANAPRPIGVPEGYVPPTQGRVGPIRPDLAQGQYIRADEARSNPYMTGDEWRPASAAPEAIAALQSQLASVGLLRTYRIGVWDENSRQAYRNLLEYANGLGMTDGAALARYAQSGAVVEEETPRAPLVTRVSNPQEIRSALRATFSERLGSVTVDDAAIDRMVAAYKQRERDFQQQAYNAAVTGGNIVEPPGVETFADIEAKKADPAAYDAYKALDAFSVILDTMGGQGAVGS